jgi:hypothetical protein
MYPDFKEVLEELSYKVGIVDLTKESHKKILVKLLRERNFHSAQQLVDRASVVFEYIKEYTSKSKRVITEDEVVKGKDSGNVYTVKTFNPDKHVKPTPAEIEKAKASNGGKLPSADEPASKQQTPPTSGQKLSGSDFQSSAEKGTQQKSTEVEVDFDKMNSDQKKKYIQSIIDKNSKEFDEAENKTQFVLDKIYERNEGVNDKKLLPPGNPGSSLAESNGGKYINEFMSSNGVLSKEREQEILNEIESTPLAQSMPPADRKRWAKIALKTAKTEANVLLKEKKYRAKNPQPEGFPQGTIMDLQNKAIVQKLLETKRDEAKKAGNVKDTAHYEKQLAFIEKLSETDTGILYITNDDTIGFKHTSNKSSYDDPHNNTSPAEVINFMRKEMGGDLNPEVQKIFDENLDKLGKASSGIQGDVQKFLDSRETQSDEEKKTENEVLGKALTKFPVMGGGEKDYLYGKDGVVNKPWFKKYAKEKELTQPFEVNDVMNAVFENAASDKPDSSAQKVILKISELVEKATDSNIPQLAKKFGLEADEMGNVVKRNSSFFAQTARARRDVMGEVHTGIVSAVQSADSDPNDYPTNPSGDNGPHQQTYVNGFMKRMHFDSYIMGERDGVGSQNIAGDNVEPQHYRECLAELSGYDGNTTTEEGRRGLVSHLSKRVRISPDNDSVSFETNDGKVVKLGVDKYRTKGDSKAVLGLLGNDLKKCLKGKAQ